MISDAAETPGCSSARLERTVRDREVGSSNLLTPTIQFEMSIMRRPATSDSFRCIMRCTYELARTGEEAARLKRQGSEQAIQLALESKWEEAAALNRSILAAHPARRRGMEPARQVPAGARPLP